MKIFTIIEKKCREVERHRTKLNNFIDMRAEGEIDKESYTKKTAEVKAEIAKLSAGIEELQLWGESFNPALPCRGS